MSRLRDYIDHSPDYIFIFSKQGVLLDINKKALQLYPKQSGALLGKHISELAFDQLGQDMTRLFGEVLLGGEVKVIDDLRLPEEMGNITVKLRAFPIEEGLAISLIDISAYKRAEKALYKSRSHVRDLAYVTAHDMKSPLSNLEGLLALLNADDISNEEFDNVFGMVKTSINQLIVRNRALNKVLAATGDTEIAPTRLQLQEVLDDIKARLQLTIRASEAQIIADFQRCPSIEYPRIHLESIVQNLISNSLKFSKEDTAPIIHIRSESTDGKASLIVSDNGRGMDLSVVGNKLFKLFRRLNPEISGDGIGLYLVKSIVESHGGSVEVESQPGKGTTFKILLFDD